ncbi:hypothetical protein [Curtobacterium sp. MCSS17_015]|uniref:hypothetical protein n=1 Tax=Curtobacterium sp. MCSS17_015 TaxID=2175666 RepID=UPI000DA960AF|nr:hypothetical protein [Curtobacterium sp. MCSS17_015]WIB25799.1 hypothetical protein DEJ18_12175 [Curtobacterium sp. MCSS17_015]
MQKYIVVAAALAMTLGLAACSGGEVASTQPGSAEVEPTPTATKQTPVENIDKTWTFEYQGATGTFTFGDSTDPKVQAVDAARASVGAAPVGLVAVHVDNTNGTSAINMYGMTIVTKDGQQLDSDQGDIISAWMDAAGDDTEKYNALVDVQNNDIAFDLQPGAKGTAVVAFEQPVTSAWRVTVMPAGGFDQVEATAS